MCARTAQVIPAGEILLGQMFIAAAIAALFALWFGGAGWFMSRTLPSSPEELQTWRVLLQSAIRDGDMVLHYAPEVDPTTGRVTAVEALPYWNHPQLGLLSSDTCLQISEGSDVEIALCEWVFKTAGATDAGRPPDVELRIKVTPNQLVALRFLNAVDYALSRSRMDPMKLRIEVTQRDTSHSRCHVDKVLFSLSDRNIGWRAFLR